MPRYKFNLDNAEEWGEFSSDEEACMVAEEWVTDGEWGEGKLYVYCYVYRYDDDDDDDDDGIYVAKLEIEVGEDPPEPPCSSDKHEWESPHEIVGGCRESPGIWSLGGTQISIKEVCAHCGCIRNTISESTPGQYPREPERVSYED